MLKWTRKQILTPKDVNSVIQLFPQRGVVGFDLETTGLDIWNDTMFQFTFGFLTTKKQGYVFTIAYDKSKDKWIKEILEKIFYKAMFVVAHNARFDFHILENSGFKYLKDNIVCSKIVASFCVPHKTFEELSLKPLSKSILGEKRVQEQPLLKQEFNDLVKNYQEQENLFFALHHNLLPAQKEHLTKIMRSHQVYKDFSLKKNTHLKTTPLYQDLTNFFHQHPFPTFKDIKPSILIPYAYEDVELVLELMIFFKENNKWGGEYFWQLAQQCRVLKYIVQIEKRGFHIDPKGFDIKKVGYNKNLFEKRFIEDKVFFQFNQLPTHTGRWICNLQNTNSKKGVIGGRDTFIAPKDYVLVSFDFKQVEFRLQAHLITKDLENLPLWAKELMDPSYDIHLTTAKFIQNNNINNPRQIAKILNHAILYGAGMQRLEDIVIKFNVDKSFAQTYYDFFFVKFAELKQWREKQIKNFKNKEFSLNAFNQIVTGEPHYAALNHLVQSSTSYLLNQKVLIIGQELERLKLKSYIQFTLHDEIICCIHKNELEYVKIIKEWMEDNHFIQFPLPVGINYGKRWSELKPWKEQWWKKD